LHTTPPDGAHGAGADLRCDRPDLERELRGAGERVAPLVHRRRPGVRGLALPRDLVALDAERPEHDTERQVERLEHRSLLDVQLEIRDGTLELLARVERTVEVDAVLAQCIRQRDAVRVAAPAQLVLVGHRARRGGRAEERAPEPRSFLVGPIDEPNGERRRPVGGDAPQHLDPGHHVQAAVQPAAVRHGVDVSADQQRPLRIAPEREPLVAGLVDLLRRSGPGNLVAEPAARGLPRLGPGDPLGPVLVAGELAKLFQLADGA